MGCGSSQVGDPAFLHNINKSVIKGFDKEMQQYIKGIVNQKLAPTQDVKKFLAYFLNNETYFSLISQHRELCSKYYGLIKMGTQELLDCIPYYIESNLGFALIIAQILSMFSLVLFAFYSNEKIERKLDSTEREKLIQQIEKIEERFAIEMKNHTLTNNVQFHLFFIKSSIAVTPTDSKEGKEILKQFGKGLFNSLKDFSIDGDFLASIAQGVIYIFKEYKISRLRRQFKVLYYINYVKLYVLNKLDESNDKTTVQYVMKTLQQLYLEVIKKSQDWEIWCFWIYTISNIFSYKRKYKNSERDSYLQLEQSEKVSIIHEINDDEFVLEANWKMAQNKNILNNILVNNPLFHIQASLLTGNKFIEGLEQIYFEKMTQDKNCNEKVIQDSLIIRNINFLTHIRDLQQNYMKHNDKEQFTEVQLQEQINLTQDLILKITQLELQLQEFTIWQTLFSVNENDVIIELQIIELISSFAENCQAYQQELSQNQSQYQQKQQFNKLFEKEINDLWLIIKKDNGEDNKSIENLKLKCDNLKKESKYFELSQDQLKTKIITVIKIIFCTFSFLRLNISTLQKSQIELITFQVKQNDQQFKTLQQNQQSNKLLTLFDYQLINDGLQILYQLVQQIKLSEHKNIQQNRINSKLKIAIEGKFSMFNFQYSQYKEIAQQFNQDKILQTVILEQYLNTCKNFEKYLKQLTQGLKMIENLLKFDYEKKTESERNDFGQKVFEDNKELQKLEEFLNHLFDQNTQEIKKPDHEIKEVFNNFFNYLGSFNQELNSKSSKQIKDSDLIKKKFEKLKNIEKCLLIIQRAVLNKEKIVSIIQEIIDGIIQQIKDAQNIELTIDDNIKQIDFQSEIKFFQRLIQETLHKESQIQFTQEKLNKNLILLTNQLVEEKEIQLFESLNIIQSKTREQYYNSIKKDQKTYQITQVLLLNPQIRETHEFPDYPRTVERDIYFLLDQIGSQEVCQEQQNIYDKYKEKITDIIDQHQWRVRQTIVYSLLQIQDRCLQEENFKIVSGLLVKLNVLETDKRIKQLFKDQKTVQEMNELTKQYWPTQEESIQKIIKEKLKTLDALGMQISSERISEKKKALIKQYTKDQDEINNQIKNIENISSSLGITVLFLQDLKNNLLRIENKLQELQDSINEIGQNIKYLMGRPYIDLFEIRMNKVLDQAQIFNAEKVYVPIKTREKNFNEGQEEEETPLFTDDIIGEGEINEFLLQQEKNSFLIHGVAGSGKSTAARKIEEFLWDLYQKAKLNTESIPIIPIFIPLPQLKDPLYYAVEETLRSDNYRFNERHIEELKEAIEQGQYRIIIIMDSYDELKQDYLESNLNISNKLSKWKSKKKDTSTYPKIITTSRTEVFTVSNYHTWFMSESNDIRCYKEIRLVKFNELQTKEYFNKYYELSKKKIIREHSDSQDIIQFEKIWKQEQSNLQIEKIVKKDQINLVNQLLSEQWKPQKFQDNIQAMNLESLLETPYMLEIVVIVLPQIVSQKKDKLLIKDQFIEKYPKDNKESLKIWNTLNEQQYNTFWSQYFDAFTEEEIKQVIDKQFKNYENISIALKQQPLTSFDFYLQFFKHYFDRESQKLREKGEHINMKEIWQFTQSLAVEMTFHNISSVQYEQTLFKRRKKDSEIDWRDEYFNDNEDGLIKSKIRKCMPLNQKNNIYAFNHKSLQEFLVAKWFIENLEQIEKEEKFTNVNWQEEYLQGPVRFLSQKLKHNQKVQEELFQIIQRSQPDSPSSIQSASNAIHLLNQMNYPFWKKDLSQIALKNVDLSGTNFYKTNLSKSKFTNVNISGCNFSEADLTAVEWQQMKLNEMGQLSDQGIDFISFFDENCILVGNEDRNLLEIECYDSSNFEKINDYHFPKFKVKLEEVDLLKVYKLNQLENDGLAIVLTKRRIYIVDYKQGQIIKKKKNKRIKDLLILDDEKIVYGISGDLERLYDLECDSPVDIFQIDLANLLQINIEFQVIQTLEIDLNFGRYSDKYLIFGNLLIDRKSKEQTQIKKQYYFLDASNSIVVFLYDQGIIHVYHDHDMENYKQLEGHKNDMVNSYIIKNGERLLSVDRDNTLIYWDLLKYEKLYEVNQHISDIATHRNLSKFCIKIGDSLQLWDLEQSVMKPNLQKIHEISCCSLSFDNKYAITGSKLQSSIIIWDLLNGKQFGKAIRTDEIIIHLQFSKDSLSFYSTTINGFIYHWELATQKQLTKINNLFDCIDKIYPIDLNRILTVQSDGLVKLWNLSNNTCTFQVLYDHKDNEIVEQFDILKTNEYYQRSIKFPFVNDLKNADGIKQIIRTSQFELECNDQGYFRSDKLDKRWYSYSDDFIVHQDNIYGFTRSKIIKTQISLSEKEEEEYRQEYIVSKDHRIANMIQHQEYLILLIHTDDQEEQEIKQIIEFRKLNDLEKIYNQITISKVEGKEQCFKCFDVNEDILFFGGSEGTLSIFDINQSKLICEFKPHQNEITQIKYLAKHESVLTVSRDAKIILSRFDQIIDEKKENEKQEDDQENIEKQENDQEDDSENGQPIYFLSVSNDQNQIMIGSKKRLSLYFIQNEKLILQERFDRFKNISFKPIYITSLFVDFENLNVWIVVGNKVNKAYLSLKRIIYAVSDRKYNSCKKLFVSYDNESKSIYGKYIEGAIYCWDLDGRIKQRIKLDDTYKDEFQFYKNQFFLYKCDTNILKIYDLEGCQKHSQKAIRLLEFFHIINDDQLIFFDKFSFQLSNSPKKKTFNQRIEGSDKKKDLLAICTQNCLQIYNLENLSLQYDFSNQKELNCDNANIKDAIIKNQNELNLKPIFFQKHANEQGIPLNQQ